MQGLGHESEAVLVVDPAEVGRVLGLGLGVVLCLLADRLQVVTCLLVGEALQSSVFPDGFRAANQI